MWYLSNQKTQHVYYLIPQTASYTVGRVKTDLLIQGDDSISRNHAVLQPAKDVLKLTDTASRYGTYVNDNIAKISRISKDLPTELRDGDTVQFGRCGSVWTVGSLHFRCLTSALVMNDELNALVQKIGIELESVYSSRLTHLIMPTITVTTKFLQCLVGQVPVVSPDYLTAIDASIEQGLALPSAADFVPHCTESYIKNEARLFHPKVARRNIFKGKEFIFFTSNQHKQFEDIVKLAGGVCLCAQREKIAKSRFVKQNAVVIKLKNSGSLQSQSQSLDSLAEYFATRGRRMIPDVEIGLAILYASAEKYCNPEYNFAFNAEECCHQKSPENDEILAKNTMHTECVDVRKKAKIDVNTIPETELTTEGATESDRRDAGSLPATSLVSIGSAPVLANAAPVEVSLGRRVSKRLSEVADTKEKKSAKEIPSNEALYQEAKRPRRTLATSTSKNSSTTVPNEPQRENRTVARKLNIQDTESAPGSIHSSPSVASSSFLAVNRETAETGITKENNRAKSHRLPNLMLETNEDDIFNFEETVLRKKPRLGSGVNQSARLSLNVRENNLFSFEENQPFQRSCAANQRKPNVGLIAAASKNYPLNNNSSNNIGKTGELQTSLSQKRNAFRNLSKPIPTSGWLSSAMCGLKLEPAGDHQSSAMKIKQEPLDTSDSVDGCRFENKQPFSERKISFAVIAHRPPVSDQSWILSDGVRNMSIFVKKRNYKVPQEIVPMKPICVCDDN